MKKILFVCTGNTCRSSMAEALFRARLEADPTLSAEFASASAGLHAFEGDPASQNSLLALKYGWDIDMDGHRAKRLTSGLAGDAFLILTMTRSHKEAVIQKFPEHSGKVFTLLEYVSESSRATGSVSADAGVDISDPYGCPYETYMDCARRLDSAISILTEKLRNVT